MTLRSVVVLDRLPYPPRGGRQLRYRQAIEALTALGPTTLLWLDPEPARPAPPGLEVVRIPRQQPRGIATRLASLAGDQAQAFLARRWRRSVRHRVARTLGRLAPDLVLVESAHLMAALPPAQGSPALVYDAHNVEGALWSGGQAGRSPGRFWQKEMLEGEARLACSADQIWLCSDADLALFRTHYGERPGLVLMPNTVDADRWHDVATGRRGRTPASPPMVIFTGDFAYPPNEEAALDLLELMPRLRGGGRTVRLVLCGRRPSAALQEAASRDPDVIVTGEVEDTAPWLASATVTAVPLRRGGGTRLKILEAFAAGCPVVSTAKGAEGLHAVAERHLLIAELTEAFASAVLRCINEPELAAARADAARELVEQRYSWAANAARVAAAVADLRSARQGGGP